jgi:hypothetical protein
MLPNKLFTIRSDKLDNKNFIYMFNASCQKEFNSFSSGMNNNFKNETFTLIKNNPELPADQQGEIDFNYINLDNKKEYKSKKKIMEKCSEYRFRKVEKGNRWALERSGEGSTNWFLVNKPYPDMEDLIQDIQKQQKQPTLVQKKEDDFVLIATTTDIEPTTNTKVDKSTQSILGGISGRKNKKNKKIRKHRGIIQTGGSKGKLKKGYRFSGKKLKSGMPEIVKAKKI